MHFPIFIPQLLAAVTAVRAYPGPTTNPSLHLQPRQQTWTVGQTVNTSSGPVRGQAAPENDQVSEYLGIPYATAERFKPPERYEGTSVIDGTKYGDACPGAGPLPGADPWVPPEDLSPAGAKLLAQFLHHPLPQSEDCLTLNIWTEPEKEGVVSSAGSNDNNNKPVLVFIHGGSFTGGSGSLPIYRGVHFAHDTSVVLVTFNYRLGVFGSPGNPSSPSNLALLDQRLAVEWVRDNIASFGGDPDRIVLFGESAGGYSVDLHSLAASSASASSGPDCGSSSWGGFLAGFIAQSGLVTVPGIVDSDTAAERWGDVVSAAGCGGGDHDDDDVEEDDVQSCMTALPWSELLSVATEAVPGTTGESPFYPVKDGELVPNDLSPEALQSGSRLNRKPMMIGQNDREAIVLKYGFEGGADKPDILYRLYDRAWMDCPARARADSLISGNGDDDGDSDEVAPLWRYRYFGSFLETELGAGQAGTGAFHGGELPVLFGTLGDVTGAGSDSVDEGGDGNKDWKQLGKYMRGAWAAFAKDPANGLADYRDGWPAYTREGREIARLGLEDKLTGANPGDADDYDGERWECDLLDLVQEYLGGQGM